MSTEQTQDQNQDQTKDTAVHALVIGNDAKENAVVVDALRHYGMPLQVEVKNLMPRNLSLPGLTTEVLQHVAAGPEASTGTGAIRDHDSLVRLVGSVHSVCKLNDYRNGVAIKPLGVKAATSKARK